MDKEKFVQRVSGMIYSTCGCNLKEGIEVLEECLKRAKNYKKFPRDLIPRVNKIRLNKIKSWAKYVKTHPDEEWSKIQNVVADKELRKLKLRQK